MRRNPHKVITLYFLPCLSALLLLGSCYGNPKKVVENAFLGTWHIDTSRVHLSISISPGASGDLSVLTAFVNNNYQSFRDLLKEPEKIVLHAHLPKTRPAAAILCNFLPVMYTPAYTVWSECALFQFYDTKGRLHHSLPGRRHYAANRLFHPIYMRALLQDYIAEHYPLESET